MIRYATRADSSIEIARLIHQTDDVFRHLFGRGEPALDRIRRLVESESNTLSYRNTAIFESSPGKVAGVMLAHTPSQDPRKLKNEDFHAVFSSRELLVLWLKSLFIMSLDDKSEIDGLYISNVSVNPNARGTGIGARLIEFAESRAVAEGHSSLWLDVAARNVGACRLYKQLGFEVNSERRVWFNGGTFLRMRKQIGLPLLRA
jgi:ribosomal protein S18 acetylase RimI-like enzyme